MVQEKLCKRALQQDTFVDGFSNKHAKQTEIAGKVRDQSRHRIRIEGALSLRLKEESVLRIENLLRNQGHKLLEQPASVNTSLVLALCANELNPEDAFGIFVAENDGVECVFNNVFTADLDVATHVEVVVLVLFDRGHHMLEDLGTDFEVVDLRTVL